MEIEKIIYDTTREIYSVEDKLSIATVFIFCNKIGSAQMAELLYTNNHKKFIKNLNLKFADYDIDFSIRFDNQNVKNSFYKTLEKVIEKEDSNGYYKALFNKDPYALLIADIVKCKFDYSDFKRFKKELSITN
jgi:hypothetical protein